MHPPFTLLIWLILHFILFLLFLKFQYVPLRSLVKSFAFTCDRECSWAGETNFSYRPKKQRLKLNQSNLGLCHLSYSICRHNPRLLKFWTQIPSHIKSPMRKNTIFLKSWRSSPALYLWHAIVSKHAKNYDTKLQQGWFGSIVPIEWLRRSADLASLDFFMWSFVKNVFSVHLQSLSLMEEGFQQTMAAVSTDTLQKVCNNISARSNHFLGASTGKI